MELEDKILEALNFYVNDPSKRCTNGFFCKYSGKSLGIDTPGCIVGYFLPEETRKNWDKKQGFNISCWTCIDEILPPPAFIQENLYLFSKLQIFHDDHNYWSENSLNKKGKIMLEKIIEEFKFNKTKFEHLWK